MRGDQVHWLSGKYPPSILSDIHPILTLAHIGQCPRCVNAIEREKSSRIWTKCLGLLCKQSRRKGKKILQSTWHLIFNNFAHLEPTSSTKMPKRTTKYHLCLTSTTNVQPNIRVQQTKNVKKYHDSWHLSYNLLVRHLEKPVSMLAASIPRDPLCLQGLSERMLKVKCEQSDLYSTKIDFLE